MRVSVGVLTYQTISHNRLELLRNTLHSLQNTAIPFDCYVVDNHSTDGTGAFVAALGGYCSKDALTSCGHGMNLTIRACLNSEPDLIVFSNDDIEWKPNYLETLVRFWEAAPDDLLICSGHLEPEYFWNTPREVVEYGGVKALVRDTAPGGTWSFRAKDWPLIGPVPETPGEDDVLVCQRLKAQGFRVAQMDVATHVGEEVSTWGNGSARFAKPLDEKWSIAQ